MAEKRKHPRFKASEGAFAVCLPSYDIVGQIIDVSQSGISFSYIADQTVPENLSELGIMFTKAKFSLRTLPFQSVSDIIIPGHPASKLLMRRHSGQFLSPTPAQQKKLKQFIQLQSKGKV